MTEETHDGAPVPDGEAAAAGSTPRPLSPEDLALLHKHLLELVQAKAPLPEGLRAVGLELDGGRLLPVLEKLRAELEQGVPLSEALARCGDAVPPVYVKLLASGEATGDLEGVLELLVNQAEVDAEIDGRVRDAVVYPAVTLAVIVIAGSGALALIVPGFNDIYTSMGIKLPAFTQAVLTFGSFCRQAFPVLVVLGLIGAGLGPRLLKPLGRLLLWPLIAPSFHLRGLAGFSRALAGFLARDVPAPKAVKAIREATGDLLTEPVLAGLQERLENGEPLSEALRPAVAAFPPTYVWVVAMGEQRGTLSESLLDLARRYEERFRRRVIVFSGMLTPMLLFALGVVVWAVAMAVFLPIFQLQGLFF